MRYRLGQIEDSEKAKKHCWCIPLRTSCLIIAWILIGLGVLHISLLQSHEKLETEDFWIKVADSILEIGFGCLLLYAVYAEKERLLKPVIWYNIYHAVFLLICIICVIGFLFDKDYQKKAPEFFHPGDAYSLSIRIIQFLLVPINVYVAYHHSRALSHYHQHQREIRRAARSITTSPLIPGEVE